jgi:hypothetical protein
MMCSWAQEFQRDLWIDIRIYMYIYMNRRYEAWVQKLKVIFFLLCSWVSSNFSTIMEGSRYGLTSARCCNYSYVCSWWCVELPSKTCRAVCRDIIKCI